MLLVGYWLILSGRFVTGREHDRLLQNYAKLVDANDILTTSLQAARDNNASLLNSGQLTTSLLNTLTALAQSRGAEPPPHAAGTGGT